MNISSRTPEGRFNQCPICGQHIWMEPSGPSGDAPCPHCGVLLWFVETEHGLAFFDQTEILHKQDVLAALSQVSSLPDESSCEVRLFEVGSRVRIREGAFKSFEGTVEQIEPFESKVRVVIEVFGRRTPVEVDLRQLESI